MRRLVLFLLFVPLALAAQENSVLDQSRDVLRYGIDSEVLDLIDRLADQGEDRLDDALLQRFVESRNRLLQARVLEFYEDRGVTIAGPAVSDLILSDVDLDNTFLRTAVRYLSKVAELKSPELLARYEEIANANDPVAASVAIGAIGADGSPESIELLLKLLDDFRTEELRSAVVRALGDAGRTSAVEVLERMAADPYEELSLRQYAAEALGKIGDPGSEQVILALLSEENSLLRAYAVAALGNFPGAAAAAALEDALRDSFWRVRVAALQGIATRAEVDDIEAVGYTARRDPEAPARQEAVKTLAALETREAYDILADIADDTSAPQPDRLLAIELLVKQDLASSLQMLRGLIDDEWAAANSRILDGVARNLSTAQFPGLAGVFDKLLTHPNFVIRVYAIRGIGRNGFVQFSDQLISVARDYPTGLLNTSARSALEQLGVPFPEDEEPSGN